ncbi:hypothetical protein K8R04_01445 [Candidatus Uhrbacteria bacterium]|nr:hypothetical protein [Candidatus Uhrbacteria bacterium]
MKPNEAIGSVPATMTAERWCVRLLSIPYYFAIGPFLLDLFTQGLRWRSAYLMVYILLSVGGLQAGYKENDTWVRVWYWLNLPFVAIVTVAAFYYEPFSTLVSMFPWERWVHFAMLLIVLSFFPLKFFLPRTRMKPVGDWNDEPIEPPFHATVPAPTPAPIPPAVLAIPINPTPPATEPAPTPTPNTENPTPTPPDPGLLKGL